MDHPVGPGGPQQTEAHQVEQREPHHEDIAKGVRPALLRVQLEPGDVPGDANGSGAGRPCESDADLVQDRGDDRLPLLQMTRREVVDGRTCAELQALRALGSMGGLDIDVRRVCAATAVRERVGEAP